MSLASARRLVAHGQDAAATAAYLAALRASPTDLAVLEELAVLARATGHRAAAHSALRQAVALHPACASVRTRLGDLLAEDDDWAAAQGHYAAAIRTDPGHAAAQLGLARVLRELGDPAAEAHWRAGSTGPALRRKPYRGVGPAIRVLLLVSARGGNVPARHWIDDRQCDIAAVYADFPQLPAHLPPHDLAINLIGDADACAVALAGAARLLKGSKAGIINPPERVATTGRVDVARRLGALPGVIAPRIRAWPDAAPLLAAELDYPLLLRAAGFHTGRHFYLVTDRQGLGRALASLPAGPVLTLDYLDARGADGMARKYRALFVDGAIHPVHLAISADWKVHYFSAAMAANAAFRAEEQRFLEDMPGVLGAPAMAALRAIGAALGLDYAGVDFALAPDGRVQLFEANATMLVAPPEADPIWDYRRAPIARVLGAARAMVRDHARLCR